MFDDEEDDVNNERSEFEAWFDTNRNYFTREEKNCIYTDLDLNCFYIGVYCPIMQELAPAWHKLVMKQYPLIDTENRPLILQYIDRLIKKTGHEFLLNLYELVQDQKQGINLREKYPDFVKWTELYPAYRVPNVSNVSIYDQFCWLTPEQKTELIVRSNQREMETFNYLYNRIFEFIHTLQEIVFKHYRAVYDLDADGWSLYSFYIQDEYFDYRMNFEHIDTFIEYDFPEEDIHLKYNEYMDKYQIKYEEKLAQEKHLRKRS